jgi:hypothetical protein
MAGGLTMAVRAEVTSSPSISSAIPRTSTPRNHDLEGFIDGHLERPGRP